MNNIFSDIYSGAQKIALWKELGKLDLKVKYRGTLLGIFWIVLAIALKISIISLVFSKVLDRPLKDYVLYLGVGVVLWNYMSSMIVSGGQVFLKGKSFLSQMQLPQSIFVFQTIYRETIILFLYLCFLVPLHLFLYDNSNFIANWPWIILGIIIILLNAVFAIFWIGWLTAKFRDVQQLTSNLMTIAFIVTPILFPVPENANYLWLFDFNPFYHLLSIVRSPLVSGEVNLLSYYVSIGLLCMNILISSMYYRVAKRNLILWLI